MKKNTIIRLSLVVGLLIFAFIVYRIGLAQIWENIRKITWENFLILIGLRFFYWILRTYNWKIILNGYNIRRSFSHLFAARMSCHAVSHLTPAIGIGGEAARAMVLDSPDMRINVASVIVDKTIEAFTVIIFTIIGVGIAITRIAMPGTYKIFLVSFVFLFTIIVLFLFSKQKKGMLGWLVKLLKKIKIKLKILEKHKQKIEETDAYISDFYYHHPKLFLKVFWFYSLLIIFWTIEIHYTLVFIGAQITLLDSFLVVALGTMAFAFPLTPASLGVYEAAYVGIFALLKLGTDVGFTMVLIRRIIALIWAGVGLLGMFKLKLPSKQTPLAQPQEQASCENNLL